MVYRHIGVFYMLAAATFGHPIQVAIKTGVGRHQSYWTSGRDASRIPHPLILPARFDLRDANASAARALRELQQAIAEKRDDGLLTCEGALCRNMTYVRQRLLGLRLENILGVREVVDGVFSRGHYVHLYVRVNDHSWGGYWDLDFRFEADDRGDPSLQNVGVRFTWTVLN